MTFACGDGDGPGDARRMSITWAGLADAIDAGEVLYLADGVGAPARHARCARGEREIDAEVEVGGIVASRQGLNIPGPVDELPGGAGGGPRAPARRPAHRRRHRRAVLRAPRPRTSCSCASTRACRSSRRSRSRRPSQNAEEILRVADCVMVARGDLGIELPIEEVPIVQKKLLALAGWMARPSITATQMLDSMVTSSRPTRAEVADVANAILDGTDAVMLSPGDRGRRLPGRGHRDDGRDRARRPSARRRTSAGPSSACSRDAARPGLHRRPQRLSRPRASCTSTRS